MAKKDTTSIGFEDKIWKAADVLRGNLNASEYEGVVLGLIFLKYISDKFEEKFSELSADEYADEEDKDEYTADNVFFVPKNARWSVISAAAHTPQVGTAIDDAMLAIEQENPRLKGILPKNFARPELDKRRLGDVVDLFSNIQMHSSAERKTCWAAPMNTAFRSLPRWRARTPANSTPQAALCAPSWRFSSPTKGVFTTLAAGRVACLCRVPNSSAAIRGI